jgi:hypothetical protein
MMVDDDDVVVAVVVDRRRLLVFDFEPRNSAREVDDLTTSAVHSWLHGVYSRAANNIFHDS